jgi:hypothetical protein
MGWERGGGGVVDGRLGPLAARVEQRVGALAWGGAMGDHGWRFAGL